MSVHQNIQESLPVIGNIYFEVNQNHEVLESQ
jgi:hypothetical protein